MKRLFFIFTLIISGFGSGKIHAQLFDSLQVIIKSKSSLDLRLESRYTFIDNELAVINGVRIGAAFRRKLRFGGGVSWLKTDLYETEYYLQDNYTMVPVNRYLRLGYICLYADFVFHKTKRWQLSVPIQTGLGMSWFQYKDNYNLKSQPKYFLWIYEPGISTQFKIFRWAGIGVDINYRFTLKNNKNIGDHFSSPTYAFKFLFWADQLYYILFPTSKLAAKKGPAVW